MRMISMKMFQDEEAARELYGRKGARRVIGQIAGVASGAKLQRRTYDDGTVRESFKLTGQFVAWTERDPNTVNQSETCYLPKYFAESVADALATYAEGVEFGCKVVMVSTGEVKGIPYVWDMETSVKLRRNSRLAGVLGAMTRAGNMPAGVLEKVIEESDIPAVIAGTDGTRGRRALAAPAQPPAAFVSPEELDAEEAEAEELAAGGMAEEIDAATGEVTGGPPLRRRAARAPAAV